MLRFFHAPLGFSLKANLRFPAQRFRSSNDAKKNGIIPFSHIYLTSASQLAHFRRFAADGNVLVTLGAGGADKILGHSRCPLNISFRSEGLLLGLQYYLPLGFDHLDGLWPIKRNYGGLALSVGAEI